MPGNLAPILLLQLRHDVNSCFNQFLINCRNGLRNMSLSSRLHEVILTGFRQLFADGEKQARRRDIAFSFPVNWLDHSVV